MTKVLLLGREGRLDCIADALLRGRRPVQLYTLSELHNPGLLEKSIELKIGKTDAPEVVVEYARKVRPDLAVIGPEEPLAAGVTDALTDQLGIPCVGPTKSLARLESSKSFTRELLSKYGIPGNPEYRIFRHLDGLESYLRGKRAFVVKPDGLTGGKGVKIFPEHLQSLEEVLRYSSSLFQSRPPHPAVIIEEKLEGEEFTLQSFCDGVHVVDTPLVQDHKRAYVGDSGPNTGGMGSYSCADHSLPFLSPRYVQEAKAVNAAVAQALREETTERYKGILYGSFIATQDGLRVIEYNVRFGDPEVMNVLPLLKTDFIDICEAILNGTLQNIPIAHDHKATVCKYVVPRGYPDHPVRSARIDIAAIPKPSNQLRVYYAAIDQQRDGFYLTGSRAVAFVGIADTLEEAEALAETAAAQSQAAGPLDHRQDIGTKSLLDERVAHMKKIMAGKGGMLG
jgi:phosphoribosylamine--glycine ligase